MTSVVFGTVYDTLKDDLIKAQEGLKGVESNIRKLTGREPRHDPEANETTIGRRQRSVVVANLRSTESFGTKRRRIEQNSQREGGRGDYSSNNDDEDGEHCEEEPSTHKYALQSSVVAASNVLFKPRKQVLEEQKGDRQSLDRNKRMFGMILGTLQKFQREEGTRSSKTHKREEIEKKLEKEAEEEKASILIQRQELFRERRQKQKEMRKLELKMTRVQDHQVWEKNQQLVSSFIQTKLKPCIFYMPRVMSPEMEKRQKDTRDKYRLIIAEKRAKVQKDLNEIDELYQKADEEEPELEESGRTNGNELFEGIEEETENVEVSARTNISTNEKDSSDDRSSPIPSAFVTSSRTDITSQPEGTTESVDDDRQ